MRSNRHRGVFKKMETHIGPNMTPMVDVVMCILIFFMLGTTIATPELFLKSNTAAIDKAGLGDQPGLQKLPAVRMTIKLNTVGGKTVVSAFDGPPTKMDEMAGPKETAIHARLAGLQNKISDEVQVLIVPDKSVPYQDVITIYDYCTELKFKQVAFYPVK